MITTTDTSVAGSLASIEAFFTPGKLSDKRQEILRLIESGDTALFEGGVNWAVFLPDYDKRLAGISESLDSAFGDMASCLMFLAEDHDNQTPVILSVETGAHNSP